MLEDQVRRTWKIPAIAVEPAPARRDDSNDSYQAPPEPPTLKERSPTTIDEK